MGRPWPVLAVAATAVLVIALAVGPAAPARAGSPGPIPRARLEAMLLKVSDMPAGWTLASSAGGSSTTASCLARFEQEKARATSVYVSFSAPGGFPLFEEILHSPGPAAALGLYRSARDGLSSCSSVTLSSQGRSVSGTIARLALPAVGQRSAGYRLAFTVDGLGLHLDIDLFLRDGVVGVASYAGTGASTTAIVALARRAVDAVTPPTA